MVKKTTLTCDVKIYGFCPVNVKEIYLSEGLETHRFLKGDYTIKIDHGYRTVYITDFAGTQTPDIIPRNSTVVIDNNEIVYCKENNIISPMFYTRQDGGLCKKYSYDDLFEAIDTAVKIRYQDDSWITMSSGHDSGTIVASASSQNLPLNILSVSAHEDMELLNERLRITNGILVEKWNKNRKAHEVSAYNLNKHGCKNVLLGIGADEYFTNLDFQKATDFIKDCNHLYTKQYGIQLSYPLLDPNVFFAYHGLANEYKCAHSIKVPLVEYMKSKGFPYLTKPKISFYTKAEI